MLRILNRVEGQPRANVLLAAVHYLLMIDPEHELTRFYGPLVDVPSSSSCQALPCRRCFRSSTDYPLARRWSS
jgi:hypothetical protein